jgi:hypothetical protein
VKSVQLEKVALPVVVREERPNAHQDGDQGAEKAYAFRADALLAAQQ